MSKQAKNLEADINRALICQQADSVAEAWTLIVVRMLFGIDLMPEPARNTMWHKR